MGLPVNQHLEQMRHAQAVAGVPVALHGQPRLRGHDQEHGAQRLGRVRRALVPQALLHGTEGSHVLPYGIGRRLPGAQISEGADKGRRRRVQSNAVPETPGELPHEQPKGENIIPRVCHLQDRPQRAGGNGDLAAWDCRDGAGACFAGSSRSSAHLAVDNGKRR